MINVVWFKRDIRITDHQPLVEASKLGPVLPIYVAEPSIWKEPDLSRRHFQFVQESLLDLSEKLAKLGSKLFVAIAEIKEVLTAIYEKHGPFRLFAHEENGTPITFARDRKVHKWMKERNLPFHEFQHFGVVRRLRSRNTFQEKWEDFMSRNILPAPTRLELVRNLPSILSSDLHILQDFVVRGKPILQGQRGGESNANKVLNSFLNKRFQTYNLHISKPYFSAESCSRLSPYLAWGNISMRTVVHQTRQALEQTTKSFHKKQLEAFMSRIHWHCHFIQRLESDPEIMTKPINAAFDTIRTEWDEEACQRWFFGRTGIPLVDAAMRCLHETGWVNFRTRAMLVSFVCNTLLLDWRRPSMGLAQLFLDYEPGIHFSQVQMQAGTTGFNTIRIYNPIKMGKDHDPNGTFIRRFVKELADVPDEYIHEPWLYEGFRTLGYPEPMVDIVEANRRARDVLYSVKRSQEAREISKEQLEKHGSRMRRKRRKKKPNKPEQLSFDI